MSWTISISEELIEEMTSQLDTCVCNACREYMLMSEGQTYEGDIYYCKSCFKRSDFPMSILVSLKDIYDSQTSPDWDLAVSLHNEYGYEYAEGHVDQILDQVNRLRELDTDPDRVKSLNDLYNAYIAVNDLLGEIVNLEITKDLPSLEELLGHFDA